MNQTNKFDTMSFEDMRKLYAMKQIEEQYTFPTKPSSDGYYHVYVKDPESPSGRRAVKAKTLDRLKEKVYYATRHTFKEVYHAAQKEKLSFVKNAEKLYSVKNTINVSDSCYKRFFAGTKFEDMLIEEIDKHDIEDLCYSVLRQFDLTNKGFLSFRGILKQTFKYAYEQYYISENPYNRVDYRKYSDMLMDPTPISKRVHTQEELEMIMDEIHAIQEKKPEYITAYALELQILMGLRRGEVAPLTKDDVHENYISITKEQITVKRSSPESHDRDVIVHHTKTYQDRVFPITKDIREFLDRYLPIIKEFDQLFPAPNESGVISNRAAYKLYSRICAKLGIEHTRDCIKGTHSFRRNQITKVANATGDLMLTAQMFGNSPTTIQKNYYTGYDLEKGRAALES